MKTYSAIQPYGFLVGVSVLFVSHGTWMQVVRVEVDDLYQRMAVCLHVWDAQCYATLSCELVL